MSQHTRKFHQRQQNKEVVKQEQSTCETDKQTDTQTASANTDIRVKDQQKLRYTVVSEKNSPTVEISIELEPEDTEPSANPSTVIPPAVSSSVKQQPVDDEELNCLSTEAIMASIKRDIKDNSAGMTAKQQRRKRNYGELYAKPTQPVNTFPSSKPPVRIAPKPSSDSGITSESKDPSLSEAEQTKLLSDLINSQQETIKQLVVQNQQLQEQNNKFMQHVQQQKLLLQLLHQMNQPNSKVKVSLQTVNSLLAPISLNTDPPANSKGVPLKLTQKGVPLEFGNKGVHLNIGNSKNETVVQGKNMSPGKQTSKPTQPVPNQYPFDNQTIPNPNNEIVVAKAMAALASSQSATGGQRSAGKTWWTHDILCSHKSWLELQLWAKKNNAQQLNKSCSIFLAWSLRCLYIYEEIP